MTGRGSGHRTICKHLFDRWRIEPPMEVRAERQRLKFRREQHSAVLQKTIVERLLAEPVARQEQRLARGVPQRKGEHPVEPLETRLAPLLPGMDNYLGVATGAEVVAERRELCHQWLKIIDCS